MNILEVEDIIKGLPDQALQKEAQAPSGQVPQFLVVSEIQRRTDMRKRFQSQQQEQPQGTVSQQIVQEGIASIAPPPQQMMPQQPMPQQQPMPPQQMPMQQMPQGNPQSQLPAQPMYRGGVVEMNQGRQATIGPLEEEEEEEIYPGVLMGGRNPMSIRQFNQDFLGETGTYSTPSGGEFVEYESPEYSFRAADRVLNTYGRDQGINTIRDAISRYAPPSDDNPTENYIDFVSKQTGIDPDQKIDLSDPIIRSNIIAPMAQFESRTTISPSGVRDSIASVDQDYAATLPERRMNALSPEVQGGVQVPTEGFPVPSVQTEDPRLSIPFVEVGPEGGQRENEFAGTESTEALLDAITKGKPFRKGQGKERQGTVARLPGEVTKAISNAIKSDADRTKRSDVDKESVEFVESFKQVDPYALVGGVIQSALPVVVDKKVKKSESYMPDLLGQIEKEKELYKNQYMPDPLGQFEAEKAELEEAEPSFLRKEMKKAPLGRYIDRYLQIMEAGRDPETGDYDREKAQAKAKQLITESGGDVYTGEPVDYQKRSYDRLNKFMSYFGLDAPTALGQSEKEPEKAEMPKTGLKELPRPRTGLKGPQPEVVEAEVVEEVEERADPKATPVDEKTVDTPKATRSGGQGVAALMSDYGRTRDEAKREAFANAMIQLGAGVAKGDLSAGLSAAGKAAAETMKDFRKEKLDQRRLDIMKDRYDQYASSTSPYNSLLLRVNALMDDHFEDPNWRVAAKQAGKTDAEYKRDYFNSLIRKHAPGFKLDPEEIINRVGDPFAEPVVRDGQIVDQGLNRGQYTYTPD